MDKYRLSTEDNPFNPFTQWDQWYFYDMSKGYNTCERIARLAKTSGQLPDKINREQTEEAIDELLDIGIAISKEGNVAQLIKVQNPNFKEEIVSVEED